MSKRYPGNSITGNPVALSQTSNNGIWDLKDNYTAVGNNTWQSAGSGTYEIPNSLRFRAATSSHLSRTPTVAGNRTTWTLSLWLKRGTISNDYQRIFSARGNAGELTESVWNNDGGAQDTLVVENFTGGVQSRLISTPVFRDPSAWYHIIHAYDTTRAAAPDRVKVYINGSLITFRSGSYPAQNVNTYMNSTQVHKIGNGTDYAVPFDGYMAEAILIDGAALDPSYFGYTDPITGIWQPKRYTGGYGTNGFYLPFNQYASRVMLGKNYNPSNLLVRSEELDNASWLKPAAAVAPVVTANAIAAPDGSTTADLVTFAGATTHPAYQEVTVPTFVPGDTYTASMYLKTSVAGTYNLQLVYFYASGGNQDGYANVVFNSSGVLTSCTASSAYMSASAQYVGNGWYRVSATNQWLNQGGALPGTTIRTSIGPGSGASSIHVWGAQINLGNTADPYVQTVASAINNSWAPNGGLVVGTNVVANTGNIIHSRYLRYTDGSLPGTLFSPNTSVFTGYALTGAGEGKNNVPIRYTPPTPIPYVTLEIKYGNSNNNNANGAQLVINGTQVDTIPYAGAAAPRIYQTTTAGTLTSCGVNGGVSGSYDSYISYIKINGVFLTDANFNCIAPDSPTNIFTTATDTGGITSGNYAVWNSLNPLTTYSQGNLFATSTSAAYPFNIETSLRTPASGKFYAEVVVSKGNNSPAIGIGSNSPDEYACWRSNGTMINSISGLSSTGGTATWDTGDLVGMAYDVDTRVITFYKNGTSVATFTNVPATGWSFIVRKDSASGDGGYLNCGQYPFAYTPPAGFKSLTTTNVQAQGSSGIGSAAITPNKYFDISLYTGNSANTGNKISGLNFAPDFVWIKHRSAAIDHSIYDTRRGAGRRLSSSTTAIENNYESQMTSFNSDGFTVATNNNEVNEAGKPYVAWQWKESPTAGLNIIPYTGTGVARSISHNLGVAPKMMIIKRRDTIANWIVYHSSITTPQDNFLYLNSTSATINAGVVFNSTNPTSSVFTVGTDATTNANGGTYVANVFAEVPGFSKFGRYVGNSAADGPFIYTGFRPKFILTKASSNSTASTVWTIFDTTRNPNNASLKELYASASTAEGTDSDGIDILSNGFKPKRNSEYVNFSGWTYIYAAFAESPFALNNRAR